MPKFTCLPAVGLATEQIESLMDTYKDLDDADLEAGRISGTVYSTDPRLRKVILTAYEKFLYSNPLHPDVFKSVRQMEAEVVAMTLKMFHGDSQCQGTMTSGGTESILLACKAYRDRGYQEKGIVFPEIIAATSVHAAFEKAAQYFGIVLIHVDIDGTTGKVDLEQMRKYITKNTIALVGSAPNFSLGVIDDIPEIAALALENDLGCHVDCCLGSFLLPHLPLGEAQSTIPLFDFRLPGVTSISADPHKYGFTPKGSSVIMYRSHHLRRYQYFVSTEWSGGIYASPTIAGSRSGAIIAGTWATMLAMGEDGYRQAASQITSVVRQIASGIKDIPDLFVFGQPASSVVAFGSRTLNIYAINDAMSQKGWHLNPLQNPAAVHIACTMLTSQKTVDDFLQDLSDAAAAIRAQPLVNLGAQGTAAIYGTNASLPDKTIIADVAKGYVDILYKV